MASTNKRISYFHGEIFGPPKKAGTMFLRGSERLIFLQKTDDARTDDSLLLDGFF